MPTIRIVFDVRAPIERCFDLSRSIDFHCRSMAHTGEVAIAGRTRGLIELGEHVTWRARHLGVTQTLESRITGFERPRFFSDEQVRGAFKFFTHEHRFEEIGGGVTRITDVFTFAAPLGPLGWLAERVFLTSYMRRQLETRNQLLKAALEGEAWQEFLGPQGVAGTGTR
ncbi:MAG: SRPBCC family protein [Phycisphaerales bacterium]